MFSVLIKFPVQNPDGQRPWINNFTLMVANINNKRSVCKNRKHKVSDWYEAEKKETINVTLFVLSATIFPAKISSDGLQ
jgi:hypothetical protein